LSVAISAASSNEEPIYNSFIFILTYHPDFYWEYIENCVQFRLTNYG